MTGTGRTGVEKIREEPGKAGHPSREASGTQADVAGGAWRSAEAARTYVGAAFLLSGLALRAAGLAPVLAAPAGLPMTLPDLLHLAAAATAGWNFLPSGLRSARTLSLDMNFLMTVAILGAVGLGETVEAGAIAVLFSVAELLETHAVDRARRSIESLMQLSPDTATVLRGGREVTVPADEVEPGEEVVVRPGERVPADGTVVEGSSAVDESALTGESLPADRGPGDEVFAGSVAREGWLRVRVSRAAGQTTLARVIHLVEEAESHRSRSERFVDVFARYYTPAVTGAAVLLMAGPTLLAGAPFETWFLRGLTLLVIACPCAMVISTPVAVVSGITAAARHGVLIKGGTHLEGMGEVRVIALDKTGTLTRNHTRVTDVVPLDGRSAEEALARAAAVEARSEHPVARAIVEAAGGSDRADRWRVEEFRGVPGQGARALLDGEEWRVGKPELFGELEAEVEPLSRLRRQGKTGVVVGRPGEPAAVIGVGDPTRAHAPEVVRELRDAGVERVVMLTGDSRETAEAVARDVGVDETHAELLPEEKVDVVRELEERLGPVAMVGDGVNDGPALAAASVGIAMGAAGSDVALETADVALMADDLTRLPYLYRLSHRGRSVIRQNIGASIGAKALLAAGVPLGAVSLIVAVLVGDMGASLGVTANSLRLARVRG